MALLTQNTLVDQGVIPQNIRVLQFGEGNFLRAFVDEMFDNANRELGLDLGVAVVQPIARGMVDMLRAQDHRYTVLLRGREGDQDVCRSRVVPCIIASNNPYAEYADYLALAHVDTLRYIVSNTTEAGIVYTGQDQYDDAPPASYPGKLTRFLHERFLQGKPGFVIMPCELIDNNGDALQGAVQKTSKQWNLGAEFDTWLETENVFCSTLVDRIVTGFPRDEKETLWQGLGYEDQQLVVAEPFGLWVIEAPQRVRDELPIYKCNPVVYTDDVKPYKLRKVRMLNGAHTTMVLAAYLCGLDTVGQCMEDKGVRNFLGHALLSEIMPNVPLPGKEVEEFAVAVCKRFENPFNQHQLLSIALNSVSKYAARVLPTLEDHVKATGEVPQCLAFGLSALIMFYAGARQNAAGEYEGVREGNAYPVKDDQEVLEAFSKLSLDMTPESLAYAVLSDHTLWHRDLREVPGLEDTVTAQLRDIQLLGMRAAMDKTWEI